MRTSLVLLAIFMLTSCSSIQKIWPKSNDPVMFDQLVTIDTAIEQQNCDNPNWNETLVMVTHLAKYANWKDDPQEDNLIGLQELVDKLNQSTNKTFCRYGQNIARQRIEVIRSAWGGR